MKRILYILGSGRSGSTLLDIMLGNAEDVFSCGELRRFTLQGGHPRPDKHKIESVRFWEKISKKLGERFSELDPLSWEKLCHEIEYHWRFVAPWRLTRTKMERYERFVNTLIDLIFEETGASWIVDSSKYPGRLLALLRVSKYPVSVVYLTRHPVGVIESFGRRDVEQPGKGFLAANHYYGVNGLLCSSAFHRVPVDRRLKIRYEDLTQNPELFLSEIAKKLGMNVETPISIAADRGTFEVGNLVAGNRIHKQEKILLQPAPTQYEWNVKSVFTRIMNRIWY